MANINSGLCNLRNIGRRFGGRNVGRHNRIIRSNHPHGTVRQLFDDIVLQQAYYALVQQADARVPEPQYRSERRRT